MLLPYQFVSFPPVQNLPGTPLMAQFFSIDSTGYVRTTAHRILAGGALSPHVSHIRFTHRLVVQLNREWNLEYGGLLCLHAGNPYASQDPLRKSVMPIHRSGFAFEISPRSFHSVTPVPHGRRYTLSYTFYPQANRERGAVS
jgi:Rps23 Pro-64 3,4-dihydroxylase Tpa1-like proline 4-hydroxylase